MYTEQSLNLQNQNIHPFACPVSTTAANDQNDLQQQLMLWYNDINYFSQPSPQNHCSTINHMYKIGDDKIPFNTNIEKNPSETTLPSNFGTNAAAHDNPDISITTTQSTTEKTTNIYYGLHCSFPDSLNNMQHVPHSFQVNSAQEGQQNMGPVLNTHQLDVPSLQLPQYSEEGGSSSGSQNLSPKMNTFRRFS
jgi:hypothetical protein